MTYLTFQEAEQDVKEIISLKSSFEEFYNQQITGEELHKIIIQKSKISLKHYPDSFLDFISQINKPLLFGPWTLPKHSSGSFFTAFTDIDWIYEQNFNQQQIEELLKLYRSN